MAANRKTLENDVQGIQSIELGGSVLRALIDGRGNALPLREVAHAAGMTASKARRYLLSFARVGLVSQDETTGYYGLGALAIRLGLAAIATLTVDRVAPPVLRDLRARLEETVVLTIWTDNGPTVLQIEHSRRTVSLGAVVGTSLPMTRSATGLVFAAYFTAQAVAGVVDRELAGLPRAEAARVRAEYQAGVEEARRRGIAQLESTVLPGVSSLCAPVFDHTGALAAGLAVLGHRGLLDVRPDGSAGTAVREAAARLSALCGYAP